MVIEELRRILSGSGSGAGCLASARAPHESNIDATKGDETT